VLHEWMRAGEPDQEGEIWVGFGRLTYCAGRGNQKGVELAPDSVRANAGCCRGGLSFIAVVMRE